MKTEKEKKEITYSDFVKALAKSGNIIKEELTAEDAHILHMAVGISGEAGELLDTIKKSAIYRKEYDVENIIEELGDLEFYMEGMRQAFTLNREDIIQANADKLMVRYSKGYSDKQAQNRADKV